MQNKIKIVIVAIFITLCTYKPITSMESTKEFGNDIWINNINERSINIKVVDVKVNKEPINVGEKYNASAIITMKVINEGTEDIELSNLDVYPYQGKKPTKYFVSTANNSINGFIGNLKPQEQAIVKMGITLYNTEDKIKVVFKNIEDIENENVVKTINMK
ncbi:MAG: hypothetical protein ACRDA3_04130 [Peptostreptococcaceae bacterium]